jgi:hypothetical protein
MNLKILIGVILIIVAFTFATGLESSTRISVTDMNSYPTCNKDGMCINKIVSKDVICYYLKDTRKNESFEFDC